MKEGNEEREGVKVGLNIIRDLWRHFQSAFSFGLNSGNVFI